MPIVMLIQSTKLESLCPDIQDKYKIMHSNVYEYQSENTKLKHFWENLIIFLKNKNISRNDIRLTFIDEIIFDCKRINERESGDDKECSEFTNISTTHDDNYQCYTMFNNKSIGPLFLNKTLKHSKPYLVFYVKLNNSDGLLRPRRANLIIHDPNIRPLEFLGDSLELQTESYIITYSKTTYKLLEKPFSTHCITYSDKYSSQSDCYDKCLIKYYREFCNCFPSDVTIDDNSMEDQICWLINKSCITHRKSFIEMVCYRECNSADCQINRYDIRVRYSHRRVRFTEDTQLMNIKNNTAKVLITTPIADDLIIIYEPKYNIIEIICYIASLLGLWFGLSVFSLSKVIRKTFRNKTESMNESFCRTNSKFKICRISNISVTPRA
jgi:hypothetical protein